MSVTDQSIDLTDCDKEKIHQISTVQSHGCMAGIRVDDFTFQNVSTNLGIFFIHDGKSEDLIGKRISEFFPLELSSLLRQKMKDELIRQSGRHNFTFRSPLVDFDVTMYWMGSNVVGVELEPLSGPKLENVEEILGSFLKEMKSCKSLQELSNAACRAVRRFSGFDRVMVYRFFPPYMFGEVIGEDKVAHSQTFMNHRFPSTDIPKPARDLYLKNEIRYIHDANAAPVDIFPKHDRNLKPLDLTDSRLRGVSLIHIEYLKNMGVRGSFSVAINIGGELWGIFSCHSLQPTYVSHRLRALCLAISEAFALSAPLLEAKTQQGVRLAFHEKLQSLFSGLKLSKNPLDQLFREGALINELFSCSGFALLSKKKIDHFGITPRKQDLERLHQWLIPRLEHDERGIFSTNILQEQAPEFAEMKDLVSGLLAGAINDGSDSVIVFFRPEYVETIHWGGDPRKNLDAKNYKGTINPRASFQTWEETLKGNALPWSDSEINGLVFLRDLVFDSLIRKEELISELSEKFKQKNS